MEDDFIWEKYTVMYAVSINIVYHVRGNEK